MRGMYLAVAAVLATVTLVAAGCGGGGGGSTSTSTETTGTETTTTATETTTTTGETTATKLIGTTGPGFTISLTTEDGSNVTTLAPGDYTLEIVDKSDAHNFHLTGPGVDVKSAVDETEDEDYDITLQDGTYDFVCDPHVSSMHGSFTVSG